jgi:hypothetical protein
MRRISGRVFFLKRVIPLFLFGFLAFFVVAMWLNNAPGVALSGPLFTAGVAYVVFKKLVFDLVDEVWDRGDALVVKNRKQEDVIPLSSIVNVSYMAFQNPNRVTLTLREPCIFGREVSFMPPSLPVWKLFSKSPIIEELIERIDAARTR